MEISVEEKLQEIDSTLLQHRKLFDPEREWDFLTLIEECRGNVNIGQLGPEFDGEEQVPQTVQELPLELLKYYKELQILIYDSSPAVNEFFFKGQSTWLTPEERANDFLTVQAAKDNEEYGGVVPFMGYEIPIADALEALKALDLYAYRSATVTAKHIENVWKLESAEAVESYDHTIGYPEKLNYK